MLRLALGGRRIPLANPADLGRPNFEDVVDLHCYHGHSAARQLTAMNASGSGSTRFGPLAMSADGWVPIWYGAATFDGALAETVFHDMHPRLPERVLFRAAWEGRTIGCVEIIGRVRLLSLLVMDLDAIRQRKDWVIDTEPKDYWRTRDLAEKLRDLHPDADGFQWVSRREGEGRAYVIFGDRVDPTRLRPCSLTAPGHGSVSLAIGAGPHPAVAQMAERLRVTLSDAIDPLARLNRRNSHRETLMSIVRRYF
jgi:hypothetical protein